MKKRGRGERCGWMQLLDRHGRLAFARMAVAPGVVVNSFQLGSGEENREWMRMDNNKNEIK